MDHAGLGTGQPDHLFRQLQHGELPGVAEIDGACEILRLHHAHHALDEIVHIAEAPGLGSIPIDRNIFPTKSLHDEIGHHPAVQRIHAGPIGVEDADDPDVHPVLPVVVEEQRLRQPLPLVVAGADADGIHRPPIAFRLGMHLGVPIDLRSAGLQDPRPRPLRQPQHVQGSQHRGLGRLDGIVLVMHGTRRTGKIVYLIHFQTNWLRHIVADELEIGISEEMPDVVLAPREKIVQTDDIVSVRQ